MSTKKLIVILGPTSSGKTGLSIKLAKKFNGEVISADSRQVYKGMDIGSGKITKKEMQGIPHYLLDVANPKTRFSVVQYKKLADKTLQIIFKKNKVPFLVGGTGFYIDAVADGVVIPEVKPDWRLREKLALQPLPELVKQLAALDPTRAGLIDQYNPRRVIRALEIALKTGKPVVSLVHKKPDFEVLKIGILKPQEELKSLIHKRLIKRLKNGAMIKEVKRLHNPPAGGLSWRRLEEFGLEYRFVARLLRYAQHCGQAQYQQKKKEMINSIQLESEHYAKRQMTWFKRDKNIHWVTSGKQAEKLIKQFLLTK